MLHFKIALFPLITYSVRISGWYGCVTTAREIRTTRREQLRNDSRALFVVQIVDSRVKIEAKRNWRKMEVKRLRLDQKRTEQRFTSGWPLCQCPRWFIFLEEERNPGVRAAANGSLTLVARCRRRSTALPPDVWTAPETGRYHVPLWTFTKFVGKNGLARAREKNLLGRGERHGSPERSQGGRKDKNGEP